MTVAVLGAGLQGICAALALRERGHRVVLIEQDREPMGRASLRNEGKIHLGFIYANDPTFRTARLMLTSAAQFAPLLDRWLPGRFDWSALRSKPFVYLMMRDSLVEPAGLLAHYSRISATVADAEYAPYLGAPFGRMWRRIPVPPFVNAEHVSAAVETEEVAVDVAALRRAICAALPAQPEIDCRFGSRVEGLQRSSDGFVVRTVDRDGNAMSIGADRVVNCLWDHRLAVDRDLGLVPARSGAYRLKYRVMAELPPDLRDIPALSLVLGQYGDVVPWRGASYLSWYPACRRGWSTALTPPPEWSAPCRGESDPGVASDVAAQTLAAFESIIPGMSRARVTAVDAGTIFAWGDRDIDRPESELHERHDVGVHEQDGYFSIDTGKLTCAPYFAAQLAQRF